MFVVDESKIVNGTYKGVMQVFSYDNANEIELPWSGQFLVLLRNQFGALPVVDYFEGNRYKLNEAIYHYRGSNVLEFIKVGGTRKTMVLVPLSVQVSAYNMENDGIKGAYIPELEKEIQKVLEVIRNSGTNVTNKEKAFLNNLKFIEKELTDKTNVVFGKVEEVLNEVALVEQESERFLSLVRENELLVDEKYHKFDTDITEANQTIDDILALQPQFQAVLDETTGKDVVSAPEIILARGGATTLGERLDESDAQLAQTAYKVGKVVSVLQYGAVGDGLNDDTDAIRTAAQYASTIGGSVDFPLNYKFRTTDTIYFPTSVTVNMDSPIVLDSTSPKPAIVYGSKNSNIRQVRSSFWAINKNQSNWSDYSKTNTSDTMYVGIKLINIGMSEITIMQSTGFTIGVEFLAANSLGFYFNNIKILGEVRNNASALEVVSENMGWVNGNEFFGGHLGVSGGVNPSVSRKYISNTVRTGTYAGNSNSFFNPNFEGGANGIDAEAECIAIQLHGVDTWRILGARGEVFIKDYVARFDDKARNNIVSFALSIGTLLKDDKGVNNDVFEEYKRNVVTRNSANKKQIFSTGALKNKMQYNPLNNKAFFPDMLFYSNGYDTDTSYVGRRFAGVKPTFSLDGIMTTGSTDSPAVKVDSTTCKTFMLKNKEKGWRPFIGLFDANGNIIKGVDNSSNIKILGNALSVRWYYTSNVPLIEDDFVFTVSENVKSIVVGVTSTTKGWGLYGLDGDSIVIEPNELVSHVNILGGDGNTYQLEVDSTGTVKATVVTE